MFGQSIALDQITIQEMITFLEISDYDGTTEITEHLQAILELLWMEERLQRDDVVDKADPRETNAQVAIRRKPLIAKLRRARRTADTVRLSSIAAALTTPPSFRWPEEDQ